MIDEDIQVGEYIRTIYGMIGKIENINDYRPPESRYAVDIQLGDLIFLGEKHILKHSFDITDLIEVGDYVNGYLIMENEGKLKRGNAYVVFKRNGHDYLEIWAEEDIETIVTHEMMERAEYKVGE